MKWHVVVRPEVERDVAEAADWYDSRQPGLGAEFREEVIQVFDALMQNPLLNCRRHPHKNIRWRYPKRFPYRVIYEVIENTVVIAAVLHAARHDRQWKKRIEKQSAS
jgi:plasmid stabilization system protein ParE